jgi:exopolyphosphatase / guanosine-5'-triphosphate,3'-diphosphate pyrophosphatase
VLDEPDGDPVSGTGAERENLAAIDLGTNSFHLVVGRMLPNGRFETFASEKEMVRLGAGSGDMKHLSPEAIERGVAALRRFRQVADISHAQLRAVATSAVREAENQAQFLRRARVDAGVEVDVISGTEEARLIHLGVLQALPVYRERLLLIDIGGGSTEILVGRGRDIHWSRSLKLGAIRLTDRFFPDGRTSPKRAERCRRYLQSFLAPAVTELRQYELDLAVGSSGTIENLALMAALLRGEPAPKSINSAVIGRAELSKLAQQLVDATTPEERAKLPGIEAKRADILPAGALLLDCLVESLDLDQLTVSSFALREGVLLDTARAHDHADPLHHLSDLRQASVEHLLEVYDPDIDHAHRSAALALELFEQTGPAHALPAHYAEYLQAGALLANIGRFIAHDAHHKHSYYVIRNSDQLTGFASHEIELIAQVARYHRKSAPKSRHPEFAGLTDEDQRAVRILAGLLRIAIGLDRGHRGVVDHVRCDVDPERHHLTIEAVVPELTAAQLEAYTADARKDLLADALGMSVSVELTTP